MPNVNGAVVVMDPITGRVLAMSGGWSYGMSQFNRAVQASRQPGSSFKPFVYLAAMDAGLTPSTIVEDAPFEYNPGYGQPIWRPGNFEHDFQGPQPVFYGLWHSRNLMTVRMAQQIGMKRVVQVAKEFGIADNMPAYLPMALGAVNTTLLRMTMAHAMLANGAREITPSLVDRVQDRNGKTIYRHEPRTCEGCGAAPDGQKPAPPRIIDNRKPFHDPQSVAQVVNMMLGVTTRGTGAQLAVLGRPIAGKTGTTNGPNDVWFLGSTPDYTIGAYVGFDEPRTLGHQEQGALTALPIYEAIARVIYKDKPPIPFKVPQGLLLVHVNAATGQATSFGDPQGVDELYKPGTEPGSGGGVQSLDSAMGTMVDGTTGNVTNGGGDQPGGSPGPRRSTLSGTGETY